MGHGHNWWESVVRPAFLDGVGSYLPKDVSLLDVSATQIRSLKH